MMRLLRNGQIRYKSCKFFYLTISELKKVCAYFVGRIVNSFTFGYSIKQSHYEHKKKHKNNR
jgi:hypothetical protein